jgi:hypothetical protein
MVGRLPCRPTAEWSSVATRSRDLLDAGRVGEQLAGRERRSQDWPLRSLVGGPASNSSRVELGRRLQAKHGLVSFLTHPQTCRALQSGVDESSPDLGAAGWYHLRTPVRPDYDLTTRPGTLGILGGPYGLDEDESLSMVLRKQTTFHGVWRVTINFDPHDQGQGAGVAVWWSKWAHALLGIRGGQGGGKELVFRYAEPNGTSFKVSGRMHPQYWHLLTER